MRARIADLRIITKLGSPIRLSPCGSDWAHRSNDLYLRAQRVEGGVASYAGSAELLLRFAATAAEFPPRP